MIKNKKVFEMLLVYFQVLQLTAAAICFKKLYQMFKK